MLTHPRARAIGGLLALVMAAHSVADSDGPTEAELSGAWTCQSELVTETLAIRTEGVEEFHPSGEFRSEGELTFHFSTGPLGELTYANRSAGQWRLSEGALEVEIVVAEARNTSHPELGDVMALENEQEPGFTDSLKITAFSEDTVSFESASSGALLECRRAEGRG